MGWEGPDSTGPRGSFSTGELLRAVLLGLAEWIDLGYWGHCVEG